MNTKFQRENALGLFPSSTKIEPGSEAAKKRFVSPYKVVLAIQDIITVVFVFGLILWMADARIYSNVGYKTLIVTFIICIVPISFFTTYQLYNYHIIFSKRVHFINLLKSLFWGGISYCIIFILIHFPDFKEINSFVFSLSVIFISVGLLVFAKLFGDHILNLVKSMGVGFIVIGSIGILMGKDMPIILGSNSLIPLSFIGASILLILNRFFMVHFLFSRVLRFSFRRQIIIIGGNGKAKEIADHIIEYNAPFWVEGTLGVDSNNGLQTSVRKDCIGELDALPAIVSSKRIDEVIITDEDIEKCLLISILDCCVTAGINVWFSPKLLDIIDRKLYINHFCGIPMIRLCTQKNNWFFNKIKHGFDAFASVPIFLFQLPFFLFIAGLIKVDSVGPIFYKAVSVGKNGREFNMLKFRSMSVDSNSNIHKSYVKKLIEGEIGTAESDQSQPLKITDDPRVTRVGKIIRKYSIDELPQLLNVVKGDMSLVGPRPCLPYEYEIYQDWHKKRAFVRPGITGLWQVTGRSEVSFEDMILLDLYYVYNRSILLDLNILYETIFVVLTKRGAY